MNSETIISTDAGIRPLTTQSDTDSFHKSREHRIVQEGPVFHVAGVKLTDFRRVATELMGRIEDARLGITLNDMRMASEFARLRSSDSTQLYEETDINEMIRRTMILHWDDYVYRRRGLKPQFLMKKTDEQLKDEFEACATSMGWKEDVRRCEAERVRSV